MTDDFLDAEPPPLVVRGLARFLIGLAVAAVLGVFLIRVPETVSGTFVLAPRDGADPVRARRDAVVAVIHVREGDPVAVGAPLFTLRSSLLQDRSGERRALATQLQAGEDRLEILEGRRRSAIHADQNERRRLEARLGSVAAVIELKRQRLLLTRELADSAGSGFRRGSVSRLDAARLELEATTLREEVETATRSLEETRADLERLAREAEGRELDYRTARRGLQETTEMAGIRGEALAHDLADVTEAGLTVAAPCEGTVLRLRVGTVGALVQQGEPLTEIACRNERLQAELLLPQSGVPRVRAGQQVKLRYDAFPYQRYGVRFGTVRWVGQARALGADSAGFRALIDLTEDSIRVGSETRPLENAMRGRADVVVGRRSLAAYIWEPLRAVRENLRSAP